MRSFVCRNSGPGDGSEGETGGAYVIFPYDIRKEFGRGRIKVHATFDGEKYDGSIVNMGVKNADGSVCYIIGVRKEIRSRIGKQPGSVRFDCRYCQMVLRDGEPSIG